DRRRRALRRLLGQAGRLGGQLLRLVGELDGSLRQVRIHARSFTSPPPPARARPRPAQPAVNDGWTTAPSRVSAVALMISSSQSILSPRLSLSSMSPRKLARLRA